MNPDFRTRNTNPEMMDDFRLGAEVIHPIMRELEVINRLLGGYSLFFDAFEKIGLNDGMVIADWGCGGGDSLREIAKWARKRKIELQLLGLDATESALTYAREKSAGFPEISFIHADVLESKIPPKEYDIVISSLFTHHFEDESWVRLIKKMVESASRAVIVNDLHRHWFAYESIGILTALLSNSEMIKHDSKLSVLRGFTRSELSDLLEQSGIDRFSLSWKWAFRWQIIIDSTGNTSDTKRSLL